MGALADALHQRDLQDQIDFKRKVKIRNFMNIAIPVGLVLGVTLLAGSFAFGASKLKEILGIVAIDGEVKFKSSKHYRYVCRLKEGGLLNKENTQMLIISFCKLYAQTVNNRQEGEYEYKLIQEISPEMIHNYYLNYKLSKNKPEITQKEKKLKI